MYMYMYMYMVLHSLGTDLHIHVHHRSFMLWMRISTVLINGNYYQIALTCVRSSTVCCSRSSLCSLSSLTTRKSCWFFSCSSSMLLKSTRCSEITWEELEISPLLMSRDISCDRILVLATPPLASSHSLNST